MADDRHSDDPIDLSALATDAHDGARAFVSAVMARVVALPAADAPAIGPLWGIWSMAGRLAFAGAVLIVVLTAAGIWELKRDAPDTVAESLGVPAEFMAARPANGGAR